MKTSTSQVGEKSNGKAKQKQQRAIPCAQGTAERNQPVSSSAESFQPAAPSGCYLAMIEERCKHGWFNEDALKSHLSLNLPGLSGGGLSLLQAFSLMAGQLRYCEKELLAGLLPVLGSAWERIELEELLLLGQGLVGDGGETALGDSINAPVTNLYTRESLSVLGHIRPSGAAVISFVAFTLHHHSTAICERVIPQMELSQAAALAEALVIAEKIVWLLTDRKRDALGTIGKPTELQRRSWEITARLWQEWPREVEFSRVIETKPPATHLQKAAAKLIEVLNGGCVATVAA